MRLPQAAEQREKWADTDLVDPRGEEARPSGGRQGAGDQPLHLLPPGS